MSAYGAVISLKNTIEYILHSHHCILVDPSHKIIKRAYYPLQPLREILERLDNTSKSRSRKKVNVWDAQIKEEIWEFEDLLESLVTEQILSQLQSQFTNSFEGEREELIFSFSIDLRSPEDDVDSFVATLKHMKKKYIYNLQEMPEEPISSRIGYGGYKGEVIGLRDQFNEVKTSFMRQSSGMSVYSLIGMAGVGKTTLALEIFEDPEIVARFECRAWITVGRKPQLARDSTDCPRYVYRPAEADGILDGYLTEKLRGECLLVLDDVWEIEVLESLLWSIPMSQIQFIQILVTARDRHVSADIAPSICSYTEVVRFLNDEESMDLLCYEVFGGKELCPIELEEAATKIARKCEGLPLMIVTVALILYRSQNTEPEYWDDVAEKRNSVFTDAYDEISKVLFPSYDCLPQYLKMPFLYMGVFPLGYDIPSSKIINMLTAEGWTFHAKGKQYFEVILGQCLEELCYYQNLVLFNKRSIFWREIVCLLLYKTCRLHSTWQHVCRGEARKNKFYQVLSRLVDGLEEDVISGQRCLCLENNILFGIKDFCNSVELHCASSTRSLLFFGPYHQYPIPIYVHFKLLRELDALNLRFYTFPIEILTLIQLKYLALTCNGEVPSTISKLFNLQVLIVHPQHIILYFVDL